MNNLKAYVVFPGDTPMDEGCLLVFAENRHKARSHAKGLFDCDYIDMTALRRPKWDDIAKGEVTYCIETNDALPDGCEPFYTDIE